MTKSLFRQSFLQDTLNTDSDFVGGSLVTALGVTMTHRARGLLEVTPQTLEPDSKHIIISCGIHGDETAPMELIDRVIADIQSGSATLKARCLFIIAHPDATNQQQRFVDENLNRLFANKNYPPSRERDIANRLKNWVADFYQDVDESQRWHLDLHCAIRQSKHYSFVVSPKVRHETRSKALFDFVSSAQIDAILMSNAPSSTFSWFTAENYAAQALTMELGRVAALGDNDLARLKAFDTATRHLLADEKQAQVASEPVIYRVARSIIRRDEDFDFLFDDDVENFTEFRHGEVFGHDGDKPLMAKNENEAIVFPNRHVKIGQRAALMVVAVSARYDGDQLVYDW